jgi:hypothetical protein
MSAPIASGTELTVALDDMDDATEENINNGEHQQPPHRCGTAHRQGRRGRAGEASGGGAGLIGRCSRLEDAAED